MPGVILSLGFLWLFLGTPFLRPLYGTTFVLILVTALGSITLGTQITKASLLQLGNELEEALALRRRQLVVHPAAHRPAAHRANYRRGRRDCLCLRRARNWLDRAAFHALQPAAVDAAAHAARHQPVRRGISGGHRADVMTIGVALIARSAGLRFDTTR